MDFKNFLKTESAKIETTSNVLLNQWAKEVENTSVTLAPLAAAFKKANFGGKMIRGALVKLGYEIAGGEGDKEILNIAASYEIFHTSILAHDDIIDKSSIRRGQPSLYKIVGQSQALTLGDLGFFLAIKIITESNFPETLKNKALKLFSKTMINTAIGQIMDIEKDDPVTVAKLKTAQYTISGPLSLGAILAGAEDKLINSLGQFGENAGIAFQIQDDILDGEAKEIDKAKTKALEYVSLAKKIIPEITKDKRMAKILTDLTDYLVERSR